MNKYLLPLFAFATILIGCSRNVLESSDAPVFKTSFENAIVKTHLDSNRKLLWNHDDQISIFMNTFNQQYEFLGETGDNNGTFKKVESGDFVTGNNLSANYAVYPYSKSTQISNDEIISLSLPTVQKYAEKSFGLGSNVMVAVTENSEDYFLPFKNLCGFIVVKLYGKGVVKSVTLKGNNNELLSGAAVVHAQFASDPTIIMSDSANSSITLDCGNGVTLVDSKDGSKEFWFCVPPVSFNDGFTISIIGEDGTTITKSTSSRKEVHRNTINTFSELYAEFNSPTPVSKYKTILCRIKGTGTKTSLVSQNIFWSQNDSLILTTNKGDKKYLYRISQGAGTTIATFSTEEEVNFTDGDYIYGLFDLPVNENNQFFWNRDYEYKTDDSCYLPMVARGIDDDNVMEFEPVGGIISISLKGSGEVSSVKLSANEILGGEVKINEGGQLVMTGNGPDMLICKCTNGVILDNEQAKSFLFSVPAGSYSGLSIIITNSNGVSVTKTTTKEFSILQKHLTNILVKDIEFSKPDFIDLGLSVKWSTCNLGATNPEDCGDYYAWGEFDTKNIYSKYNYRFYKTETIPESEEGGFIIPEHTESGYTKYVPKSKADIYGFKGFYDNKSTLDLEDDASSVNLGGGWRIPTQKECKELLNKDNCSWQWVIYKNVYGFKVTSLKSGYEGQWIFLPAAGYKYEGSLGYVGSKGRYWSSSRDANEPNPEGAYYLDFASNYSMITGQVRYFGFSIRPVKE